MLPPPHLTPEDRRALEIAVLTVALTTLVSGLVSWGLETLKRRAEEPTKHGGEAG